MNMRSWVCVHVCVRECVGVCVSKVCVCVNVHVCVCVEWSVCVSNIALPLYTNQHVYMHVIRDSINIYGTRGHVFYA